MNDNQESMSLDIAVLAALLERVGLTTVSQARMQDTIIVEVGGIGQRPALVMGSPLRGTSLGVRVDLPPELREQARDVHGDATLRLVGAVTMAAQGQGLMAEIVRGPLGIEGFVLRSGLSDGATPEQLCDGLAFIHQVADELANALPGPPHALPERLVARLGPRQGLALQPMWAQMQMEERIVPTFDPTARAMMIERSRRLRGGG